MQVAGVSEGLQRGAPDEDACVAEPGVDLWQRGKCVSWIMYDIMTEHVVGVLHRRWVHSICTCRIESPVASTSSSFSIADGSVQGSRQMHLADECV